MRIMFVCTGNSCRSPMAEAVLKKMVNDRKIEGVEIYSCGTNADNGNPMSRNAKLALKERGYKLPGFKSSFLVKERLEKSDYIFCMTWRHKEIIGEREGVFAMAEILEEVPDPFGGGLDIYRECLIKIERDCELIIAKFIKS